MRNICVKREETFVKEKDLLQQEIARREEDIKKLNLSLQIETQEEHIIILKKKTKLLQNRVNTLNETVEVLRRKSAVTLGVRGEPSHQLKQLIEKEAQLEQEYDETQKDLNNHDKLLSGHQVNMTDSPTTRGLSTLSTDKFENEEVTVRKHSK
ncbi:protein CIP2A homolog [Dreissena polymorpha]|uniref:protein CIP2A homolog n=1 Tax=Dreissena polymorpha TaxID=45954 RepID=UPI0022644AE2|nr:protein CIP2A homolog [Dreissena polymorpha]